MKAPKMKGSGVTRPSHARMDDGEAVIRVRPTPTRIVRLPRPHGDEPCVRSLATGRCLFCYLDTSETQ